MSIDALIFYHDTKTSLAKCIRTLKESCVCRVVPIHHIFVFISNKHINIINKNCTCYKSGQVVPIEDKVIDYMSGLCNAQFERPFIDVFSCFMVGKLWSQFEGFIRQDMKEQMTCTVLTVFTVNNTAEVYCLHREVILLSVTLMREILCIYIEFKQLSDNMAMK